MKNNNKRKGFTLVELLVVIAILAILATVTVVGYTSFINKAREANDLSVAKQMNDALLASSVSGEPGNFNDVLTIAEDAGFILENLNPTADGYHYIWDKEQNKFFLVDIDENDTVTVIYPEGETMTSTSEGELWTTAKTTEEYTTLVAKGYYVYGASKNIDYTQLTTATQIGGTNGITVQYTNSAVKVDNVDNESDLVMAGAMVNSAKSGTAWNITLTADITLTGEWAPLGDNQIVHYGVTDEQPDNWFEGTIDGGNHTIYNLNASTNAILDDAGLIGCVGGDTTIKDLTIDGGTVSNAMDTAGGVVGCHFKGNLTISNVTVKNMTISGEQAGGIVGCGTWDNKYSTQGTLTISSCTVESSCTISGSYQVGGIVGGAWKCTLSITSCTNNATVICEGVSPQGRSTQQYVGGIVGCVGEGNLTVTSCTNNGSIYLNHTATQGWSVGAILGQDGSGGVTGDSNSLSGNTNNGTCYLDGKEVSSGDHYQSVVNKS